MTTPTFPDDTRELPRSQATAIDPWAECADGCPPAARAEVVPTRWAVTPPPVAHAARVRPPGPTARPAARRHTSTAYALWFFLGALGAHRFYLGRPASGLAYLLAFVGSPWTLFLSLPVLGVCLLVDAVVIPALTRGANRRQGWVR